ncbi:hypothetical protein ACA30_05805 [Virgibacillus soli]|nr:hypothetical protein ACA30_05805 [Virgibacillus soli]
MGEEKIEKKSAASQTQLYQQIGESIIEQQQQLRNTIEEVLKPSKIFSDVVESQKMVVDTLKIYHQAIEISTIKESIDSILDTLKGIDPKKYHEENIRDLRERAERFSKLGWALVIDVNDDCFYDNSIFQMKKTEVDEYMLNFYEKNEHENLKSLGEYIGERVDIIWKDLVDDSIRLFINGDHKIATPFAMTLIENTMIRYSGRDKYGWKLRDDFKKRIEKIDGDYVFIASFLLEEIIEKIFDSRKNDDVKGELLNRNLVLHGKSNPEVWGKVEFLKILNIVGSMAMLDDLFEIEKAS